MKYDMINTKMPTKAGDNEQGADTSDSGAGMSTDSDAAEQEAQEIMDGIGDNHELCQALYEMLKEKYEGEEGSEEEEKSESPAEAKAEGDYDSEGMPT